MGLRQSAPRVVQYEEESHFPVDEREFVIEFRGAAEHDPALSCGLLPRRCRFIIEALALHSQGESGLLSIEYNTELAPFRLPVERRRPALAFFGACLRRSGPAAALLPPCLLHRVAGFLCNPQAHGATPPTEPDGERHCWGHWRRGFVPAATDVALDVTSVNVRLLVPPPVDDSGVPGPVIAEWRLVSDPFAPMPARIRGARLRTIVLQQGAPTGFHPNLIRIAARAWRDGWNRLRLELERVPMVVPLYYTATNTALQVISGHPLAVSLRETPSPHHPPVHVPGVPDRSASPRVAPAQDHDESCKPPLKAV
eukprot:TRINITY_DN70666_c0_g1_i1.p1 TRINITY_DN70666_c0_g1~~TRINITY_DN70666_c0_g1_i1.p1  ORF type:complete len:343 (+),score=81.07 TRINITY_DN70666_c0_g1_i1:98-1030(+)